MSHDPNSLTGPCEAMREIVIWSCLAALIVSCFTNNPEHMTMAAFVTSVIAGGLKA